MTRSIEPDARLILQLIACGHKAKGFGGRYIRVENPDCLPEWHPDYKPGIDPYLIFDTDTLYPVPTE